MPAETPLTPGEDISSNRAPHTVADRQAPGRPAAPGPAMLPAASYVEGQFSGRTLRAQLVEMQKANIGRKYASKDRRPIDPPPVVLLKLYDAQDQDQEWSAYDDLHCDSLVCHAALFTGAQATAPSASLPEAQLPREITQELAGATFVQGTKYKNAGRTEIVFVFSDLSVKAEGTFRLRYRCFDILSLAASPGGTVATMQRPMLAECFGGPFVIYTNRNFPGLSPSTELTKRLAEQGVRTNNRVKERTRQPSLSSSRKRKSKQDLDEESSDDVD